MIKSFVHKGLERFYRTGKKSGIQPQHTAKLRRILTTLDNAAQPNDADLPGYRLHELHGGRQGTWSITVQANWRVTFRFIGTDVELVDYEDYH